jgi:2-(1,2-epoxy-1,2-dihydrophenyl)acetyl-CoA isomerase
MAMELVLAERRAQGLWITLNRPESKNALCATMFTRLAGLFEELPGDKDAKYLVIAAQGPDFCSGGDVGAFADILAMSGEQRSAGAALSFRKHSHRLFAAMDRVPHPIIAVARGHAIGAGAQLILASDLVIASKTLKLAVPQARLAHTADHGESYHLPRKAGMLRAMEVLMFGDAVSAEDALRMNIVNWVVADADLEARAAEVAQRLASAATLAVRQTKALLKQSLDNTLEDQLNVEGEAFARCAGTADFTEAILALSQKRSARFSD